jgi:formate hydrogenlyase subunit 6/NADH:ubiquinone oxidoreductase subunit I
MFSIIGNIIKNLSRKPITRLYPAEQRDPFNGAKGQLDIDPNKCVYCGICVKCCPANAIVVTRKPDKSWTLDPYKCIVCGYCIEKCPKKCLFMSAEHRKP